MGNIFVLPADDSVYNITYPVAQYDHDEGNAISGGYEYWGNAIPELKGKYVFGDYRSPEKLTTGRLFEADLKTGAIKEVRIGKNDRDLGLLLKGFGEDSEGELYIACSTIQGPTGTTGVVLKITAAD